MDFVAAQCAEQGTGAECFDAAFHDEETTSNFQL